MIAYKAFNSDMTSFNKRQYRENETYMENDPAIGRKGFHAALDPMFCLSFISPVNGGVYHEVEMSGQIDVGGVCENGAVGSSAISADCMTIGRRLTVEQMLEASMRYRLDDSTESDFIGKGSGYKVMVSDDPRFGMSYAKGIQCVAVARGEESSAKADGGSSLAVAYGRNARAFAKGGMTLAVAKGKNACAAGENGTWLLLYEGENVKAVQVGKKDNILPYKYYRLRKGQIFQVK